VTGTLLLALPVLAGLAAGWLLTLRLTSEARGRRGKVGDLAGEARAATSKTGGNQAPVDEANPAKDPEKGMAWPLVIGSGLIAGPVAGVLLGLAAKFSGGSLGDGRLATIGPDPWPVAVLATLVLAVAATLGAAAAKMFRTPKA